MPTAKPRVFDPKRHTLNYDFVYNIEETRKLRRLVKSKAPITLDDLRRVALWKLDRVVDVPDSVLQQLTKLAGAVGLVADSQESRQAIESLVECEGVWFPMASTFLKFLRPDVFPIIDVRAYRAFTGKTLRYGDYNLALYLDYARRLREIAGELKRDLSDLDEQLYCFDKHGAIDR